MGAIHKLKPSPSIQLETWKASTPSGSTAMSQFHIGFSCGSVLNKGTGQHQQYVDKIVVPPANCKAGECYVMIIRG